MHRVLIVEDEVRTATIYRAIITGRWPHAVVDVVGCAESALLCIRQTVYDVIVCDVRLPQLNGFSVLVATRLFQPSTPVVIVTGY
jgi:DNA-binding NtrC family response regulator